MFNNDLQRQVARYFKISATNKLLERFYPLIALAIVFATIYGILFPTLRNFMSIMGN